MAEAGRLKLSSRKAAGVLHPVTVLRIAIILAVLAGWEALAASGLLYRDVVPSLGAIGAALYGTLAERTFYEHLGTTFYEIGLAMAFANIRPVKPALVNWLP